VKEPTALSGEIINRLTTIVEALSQQVGADPRKSRAMVDAKGRMSELYEKLNTGQFSDELEALLNEFAVALQNADKANVTRVLAHLPPPPLGHRVRVCAAHVWCLMSVCVLPWTGPQAAGWHALGRAGKQGHDRHQAYHGRCRALNNHHFFFSRLSPSSISSSSIFWSP
jgi:hypothetical protein